MAKRRFSSRLVGDKIIMRGYRALTSAEYKTIITIMLTVTSGLRSSQD
jgi:hypothetical protein